MYALPNTASLDAHTQPTRPHAKTPMTNPHLRPENRVLIVAHLLSGHPSAHLKHTRRANSGRCLSEPIPCSVFIPPCAPVRASFGPSARRVTCTARAGCACAAKLNCDWVWVASARWSSFLKRGLSFVDQSIGTVYVEVWNGDGGGSREERAVRCVLCLSPITYGTRR